jgi:hypothetical protein
MHLAAMSSIEEGLWTELTGELEMMAEKAALGSERLSLFRRDRG